ncbi:MAG: 3-deoxy-manno-octulosonate cytidylyltransferase [Nitrospirae bacterium]|nr:3-deoxy-manno-octulosonate cytidylyltransferase [Nitrospirota bacterium]
MHRVAVIIPARYNATRFPGKPLALLKGKPIIQHVYEHASRAGLVNSILVATDDQRIFDTVINFGGRAVMTSGSHESGTDRIAEAAGKIECEYVINVQGDEPFIEPEMIDDVINLLYNDDKVSISTLAKRVTDINEILSPHVVKVVMDDEGFALYFSRAPIPYHRDEFLEFGIMSHELHAAQGETLPLEFYKHIGIYGFRKSVLMEFTSLPQCRLEKIEKLEQLRALNAGMRIKVKETHYDTFGIDTIEDLRKAEEWQNISL